jgi:hypothetical protein
MVQFTAYVNLTVYEKAPKRSVYRPLNLAGKSARRVAVLAVSTQDSLCKRLLANVERDALYDYTSHQGPPASIPEDSNEYCSEDVAQTAIGFVKGEVCSAHVQVLTKFPDVHIFLWASARQL